MKKALSLAAFFLVILSLLYVFRLPLQKRMLEAGIGFAAREFFQRPIRLNSGFIDRSLQMHLRQLEANLLTVSGPVSIELPRLDTSALIPPLLSGQPITLTFEGLKPTASQNIGVGGRAELKTGPEGFYQIEANIGGLDLGEITWLNPDNLKGSSGSFTGKVFLKGSYKEAPQIQAVITSKDGYVQSKFFELLLPYLPAMPTKQNLVNLTAASKTVPFHDGALRVEIPKPHQMKIFLHIRIPDYNVELNINFEIRIEEELSLMELSQLMGFVRPS